MADNPYFDSPVSYKNKFGFFDVGSSPRLLEVLCNHLKKNKERISEIFLGFYLFNNAILNEELETLAKAGIKVHVITIPIEGYDSSSPKPVVDFKTGKVLKTATKYELAQEFFSHHYRRQVPNYILYFFPHVYLRSAKVKSFSRGNMPYSFHIKSFLIKYKDGEADVGISSSNFAVRDLVKEENLLIMHNESQYYNATASFFDSVIKNSIPIFNFDFKADYANHEITMCTNEPIPGMGFIAPFYFDSAFMAEDAIKNLIDSAKTSIIIVAQHICPVDYTVKGKFHSGYSGKDVLRAGFVNNLIAKAKAGIKVSFLSQTFASGDAALAGFRSPINKSSFIEFFNKIKEEPNIFYGVNENIHSKYIIADDKVFVSSFNYTPTQFIYLDKVSIEKFENNPGKNFKGIYCETGHYCLVDDKKTADAYRQNFEEMIGRGETKTVKQCK